MNTKHTPGPWEVWNWEADPRHVCVGPQAGGLCVADVVACNAHGIFTAETEARGMADARLIAAAPDLLDALQTASMALIGYTHRNEIIENALNAARAAIVKATGNAK